MYVKSKSFKKDTRLRRKIRIRKRISGVEVKPRISVFKSDKHTYAQAISDQSGITLASASTKEKDVLAKVAEVSVEGVEFKTRTSKSVAAAWAVGMALGEKLKAKNVNEAIFDRNGFVFHGRVKAVADGARKAGIKF